MRRASTPLPDPHLLLRELLVEQGGVLRLGLERGALLQHVVVVVSGPLPQLSAIQVHDAGREAADERAVVAHEQQRARELEHHILEPGDGLDVQMIGRLVEQQEVGLRDERASEHDAPPPAARQRPERRIAVELQPRDDLIRLQSGLPIALEAHLGGLAGDHLAHGFAARRRHLLGEARRLGAGTNPKFAAVGRDLAGNDLEQRGLALAVAPEHADSLALGDLQVRRGPAAAWGRNSTRLYRGGRWA